MACTEWVNRKLCKLIEQHLIWDRPKTRLMSAMKGKPKPKPPRRPRPGY